MKVDVFGEGVRDRSRGGSAVGDRESMWLTEESAVKKEGSGMARFEAKDKRKVVIWRKIKPVM